MEPVVSPRHEHPDRGGSSQAGVGCLIVRAGRDPQSTVLRPPSLVGFVAAALGYRKAREYADGVDVLLARSLGL